MGQSLSSGMNVSALRAADRRTRAGFGIETVGTACWCREPVIREERNRTGRSFSRQCPPGISDFFRGWRKKITAWGHLSFFFDIEIGLFAIRRSGIVTAVEPNQQARMPRSAAIDRAENDETCLFSSFHFAPFFPGIATAPAGHDRIPSRSARCMKDSSSSFPSSNEWYSAPFLSRSGIPLHAGIRPRAGQCPRPTTPRTSTGLPFTFSKRFSLGS